MLPPMKFVAKSKSDPNGKSGGLGFATEKEAQLHADEMNALIEVYPNGIWNTAFWKETPEEWEVYEK